MSLSKDQSQKENRTSSISKSFHEDETTNNAYFFRSLLDVLLESAAGNVEGRTSDISLGGCFIDTNGQVTVGETIRFTLRLPSGEGIELQGEVRWKAPGSGFGVKFENLSDESQKQVAALVKARE